MAEFVYKDEDYVNEVVPKVEIALEQLGINFALELDFEAPLSLLSLVKMMKVYQDFNEDEQKMAAIELEELLRKLFPDGKQAKGYYLSPGRGGSGVVLMRPTVHGIKGKLFVIKFGPRASIGTELEHYRNFALPFIDHKAYLVDISNKPIQTLNLAGLKFSIAGESSPGKLRDFNSFYRDSSTTTQAIVKVLDGVFVHTCKRWYEAKKDWLDNGPRALAHAYETQLNLDSPEKQEQLATALMQLLKGEMLHGLTFHSHDYSEIVLTLDNIQTSLPNPLLFVREQRTHFPRPRFSCITHGDLNGRNMFVAENLDVWLIDFYQTGWGPILRDFGEMETVIKFELLQSKNVAALYEFEQAILSPSSFHGQPLLENRFGISELNKAKDAIIHLRSLAQSVYESTDMFEYYVGLLYYALKMITWDGISSTDRDRLPIRQHHALMSASMIAYRLQNWNSWSGWPT
jgi:hypothetical protein